MACKSPVYLTIVSWHQAKLTPAQNSLYLFKNFFVILVGLWDKVEIKLEIHPPYLMGSPNSLLS